jgi:hypothetical protein
MLWPGLELGPQGLKPAFLADASGTAEEAAEKVYPVGSLTSAVNADSENNPVIAALNCVREKLGRPSGTCVISPTFPTAEAVG